MYQETWHSLRQQSLQNQYNILMVIPVVILTLAVTPAATLILPATTTGITIKIAVHRMMLTGVHVTVLRSVVLRRMHILHHFWHLLPVKGRSSS